MKSVLKGLAVAAALVSVVLVPGCSPGNPAGQSGAAGGNADLSAAQAKLAEATTPVTKFDFPTESVTPGKNFSVVAIPCAYAAEGCKRGVDAVQEAATTLGWQYQMIDPAGDPEKMRQAIATAVQLKADAVFLGATPPDAVADAVKAAQAAGVTVINMFEPSGKDFADARSVADRFQEGVWSAAFLAVRTGGAGKIVVINDPEFPSIAAQHDGFTKTLPQVCPSCEVVSDTSFQIANLQTQVPTEFQATLIAHPEANAVWTAYDPVAAAILPVIDRTDRTDSISVVSFNGDAFALQYIKDDNTSLKGSLAFSVEWQAYAAVDQLIRIKAGTITDEQRDVSIPIKIIEASNVSTIPWNGDLDWKSEYLKLWGKS